VTAVVCLNAFPNAGDSLPSAPDTAFKANRTTSKADANTWHRRLGHLHDDAVTRMVRKGMVCGMEIISSALRTSPCEPCLKGKQTHNEILKSTEMRADTVLERIFSDVCSKLPTKSHEGFEYFVTFTDDKSCNVSVARMKLKSEVVRYLKAFITRSEAQYGQRVRILRSDGGGEYMGKEVQQYIEEPVRHQT
jgi:hypothetical protein